MKSRWYWSVLLLVIPLSARADEWPCWRGPERNGISREKGWLDKWPKDGPPIAWKASVGVGFSSVAVRKGRLVTLGHKDGKDTIHCLDAATGKPLWSHSYNAPLGDNLFEGGPTATPAIHDGTVYSISRWGDVFCLDAESGKVRWSKSLNKDGDLRVPGWGFGGSPLIHDKLLLLNVGESGLALDRETGKIVWASENKEAGYSSPTPFRRDKEWGLLVSSGDAYFAVEMQTGKVLHKLLWLTRYGLNAADPILVGNEVFVSSGYNKGAAVWKLSGDEPATAWRNKNLRAQLNGSVLLDGHLYGIDGDTGAGATLRCLEWKTGEVRWTQEGLGCGSLMVADGKLIVLSDRGELLIASATPTGFTPTARAKVLAGKCWTVPVLAEGRIYCRNAVGELVCLDVRADGGERKVDP